MKIESRPLTLHCSKCDAETPHYLIRGKYRQCGVCMAEGRKLAAEKRRAAIFDKKMTKLADNVALRREYDVMKAPVYMGEKWANVRGQMTETKNYISASDSV